MCSEGVLAFQNSPQLKPQPALCLPLTKDAIHTVPPWASGRGSLTGQEEEPVMWEGHPAPEAV